MTVHEDFGKVKEKISGLLAHKQPVLLAVDGYGGAGKSTFAAKIQQEFPGSVVITLDDFGTSRGEHSDRGRFMEQVLAPLHAGRATKYQRYDWKKDDLADWVEVKPEGLIILEGVSMLGEDFNPYYDLRVWLDVPHEVASKRGMDRDKNVYKVDHDEKWEKIWIPGEKAYAKSEPWKRADYILKNI
ncbi:MAG: hypothetical protein AAB919_01205 [Patescibacteria group bacterium]